MHNGCGGLYINARRTTHTRLRKAQTLRICSGKLRIHRKRVYTARHARKFDERRNALICAHASERRHVDIEPGKVLVGRNVSHAHDNIARLIGVD